MPPHSTNHSVAKQNKGRGQLLTFSNFKINPLITRALYFLIFQFFIYSSRAQCAGDTSDSVCIDPQDARLSRAEVWAQMSHAERRGLSRQLRHPCRSGQRLSVCAAGGAGGAGGASAAAARPQRCRLARRRRRRIRMVVCGRVAWLWRAACVRAGWAWWWCAAVRARRASDESLDIFIKRFAEKLVRRTAGCVGHQGPARARIA